MILGKRPHSTISMATIVGMSRKGIRGVTQIALQEGSAKMKAGTSEDSRDKESTDITNKADLIAIIVTQLIKASSIKWLIIIQSILIDRKKCPDSSSGTEVLQLSSVRTVEIGVIKDTVSAVD